MLMVMQRPSVARWWPVAGLLLIIAAGGAIGFAVSQPPAPPRFPPPPASEAAPRSAFGYSVAFDEARGQVLFFGGVDSYDSTWLWDGRRWTQAHPKAGPAGRFDAPAAYDPQSRQVMLYGGRLADGDVVGDTWAWDGATWRELAGGGAQPPPGEGGAMVWDEALDAMVLLTPLATTAGPSAQTWLWSGTGWTLVAGSDFPIGVVPVAAAFDTVTSTLTAIGGTVSNPLSPGGLLTFVPLTWDGTSWAQVHTTTHLSSLAGLARDPLSGRLLVAASNGFPRVRATSTAWEWTGADWRTRRATAGPPWPQDEVVDSTRDRLLLFGSLSPPTQGAPQPVHVWAWEGTRWHRLDGTT